MDGTAVEEDPNPMERMDAIRRSWMRLAAARMVAASASAAPCNVVVEAKRRDLTGARVLGGGGPIREEDEF